MKQKFTSHNLWEVLAIFSFLLIFKLDVRAQIERQISLTGFTRDVIADNVSGIPVSAVTTGGGAYTGGVDFHGNYYFANGYTDNGTGIPYPNGLPDDGQIVSSDGHNFQLANYAANNDLLLQITPNPSGTLFFSGSDQSYTYNSLYILASAANVPGSTQTVNYQINFVDYTSASGTINVNDWNCSSCTPYGIIRLDRVHYSDNLPDGGDDYGMLEYPITLSSGNQLKQITSIIFSIPGGGGSVNIFAITGVVQSALPVTLENFTVTANNGKALLQWKTSQELNNSKYIIRRASGITPSIYSNIGEVEATSSATGSSYSFIDNPGVSGTYFYQLLQEDIDGNIQNLGTRSITFDSNVTWAVQNIGSQWRLICAQPFMYRLLDLQGRVITAATGSGSATIIKPDAYGIYELQVQTNGVFSTQKLLK